MFELNHQSSALKLGITLTYTTYAILVVRPLDPDSNLHDWLLGSQFFELHHSFPESLVCRQEMVELSSPYDYVR